MAKFPIIAIVEDLEKLQRTNTAQSITNAGSAPASASASAPTSARRKSSFLSACFPSRSAPPTSSTKVMTEVARIESGTAKLQRDLSKNVRTLLPFLVPTQGFINATISRNSANIIAAREANADDRQRQIQTQATDRRKHEVDKWNIAANKAEMKRIQELAKHKKTLPRELHAQFDAEHKHDAASVWLQAWRDKAEDHLPADLRDNLYRGLNKHGQLDPNFTTNDELVIDQNGNQYKAIYANFINPSYEADPQDIKNDKNIAPSLTLTQLIERDYIAAAGSLRDDSYFQSLESNDKTLKEGLALLNAGERGTLALVDEIAEDCAKPENLKIASKIFLDMEQTLSSNIYKMDHGLSPVPIMEVSKVLINQLEAEVNNSLDISDSQKASNLKFLTNLKEFAEHVYYYAHHGFIDETKEYFFEFFGSNSERVKEALAARTDGSASSSSPRIR